MEKTEERAGATQTVTGPKGRFSIDLGQEANSELADDGRSPKDAARLDRSAFRPEAQLKDVGGPARELFVGEDD